MKLVKLMMVFSLIWNLVFISDVFANVPLVPQKYNQEIVKQFNSNNQNLKSVLSFIEKKDKKTAEELSNYIKQEKVDENIKISELTLKNNTIIVKHEGEIYYISPYLNGDAKITYKKNSIVLLNSMTFTEKGDAIKKLIFPSNTFSFTNLIIDEASAVSPGEIAILVAGAVVIVAIVQLATSFIVNSRSEALDATLAQDESGACSASGEARLVNPNDMKHFQEVRDSLVTSYANFKALCFYGEKRCDKFKKVIDCFNKDIEYSKSVNSQGRGAKPKSEETSPSQNSGQGTSAVSK